jgi:hypothetical protein
MNVADKSNALLRRPSPPNPSPIAPSTSWADQAESPWSSIPDPWTSDQYLKPPPPSKPKPKNINKAKEKVFTIDEDGVKALVQTKNEARRLKEEYHTVKESHPEGDICYVYLDKPNDEDSDHGSIYGPNANFNIPQKSLVNKEPSRMPVDTLPRACDPHSPSRSTSPVQIEDDTDFSQYQLPDSPTQPSTPATLAMDIDLPWNATAVEGSPHVSPQRQDTIGNTPPPQPTTNASPRINRRTPELRRRSASPKRFSRQSSRRRSASPERFSRQSNRRQRSLTRSSSVYRPPFSDERRTSRGDSYIPSYSSRHHFPRNRSRSRSPLPRFIDTHSFSESRRNLAARLSTPPPCSVTLSSVSSPSRSSITSHSRPLIDRVSVLPQPSPNLMSQPFGTHITLRGTIRQHLETEPCNPTIAVPSDSGFDPTRQQAAAFLIECFRAGPAPFASAPIPINGSVLPTVPITVPSAKCLLPVETDLRVRYWWLQDPSLSSASWLQTCLRKGLPFRLVVPEDNLHTLRPQGLMVTHNRPNWLDNPDTLIKQHRNDDASRILAEYRHNVTAVLQRPHARRFLAEGGLLWRIALAFGPPTLFLEAFAGPSSTATVFGRRSAPMSGNLVDDLLMPSEVGILLGMTSNQQSVWPPLDLFKEGQHFNGEWSTDNEGWFVKQIERIASGNASALHTQKRWKSQFRRRNITDIPDCALIGSAAHAASTKATLVTTYPNLWDSYNTTDMDVSQ